MTSFTFNYFGSTIEATPLGIDITDSPRGENLHGWTELLYVYGHPSFPSKSLAQLNDAQWKHYLKAIEDIDPFAVLKRYLSQ